MEGRHVVRLYPETLITKSEGLPEGGIIASLGRTDSLAVACIPYGSMCSDSIYFGLKVFPI